MYIYIYIYIYYIHIYIYIYLFIYSCIHLFIDRELHPEERTRLDDKTLKRCLGLTRISYRKPRP